jgi:hypothetical protein
MRTTMLAILATLGAAMLTGSANATVPRNMAAMNSAYQIAAHKCPAGYYWKRGRYSRYSQYQPSHCAPLVKR